MTITIPELDIGKPLETRRVFIAHAKSDDSGKIDDMKGQIETFLTNAAKARGLNHAYRAVLGRDDFDAHFKRCGGWDAWAADVVTRIDYATRQPYFAGIVMTTRNIGRASYVTAITAITARRPLYLFENCRILKVSGIETIDGRDFKQGWEVQV